LILADNVFVE